MPDNPAPKATSFLRRKVAGVPVLYILIAGVVVLAVYAWRAKPTPEPVTAGDATAPAPDAAAPESMSVYDSAGNAYGSYTQLAGDGTVYASTGQVPTGTETAPAIGSNTEWLNKSVAYIIAQDSSASPGDVENALYLYLTGGQLSMQQGQWRDMALREYGRPPDIRAQTSTVKTWPDTETDPRRKAIVEYYRTILSRDPSLWELNFWDSQAAPLEDIRAGILNSPEAQDRTRA